jgi:hypothetical protein
LISNPACARIANSTGERQVHAVAQRAITLEQGLGSLGPETRVGAQRIEKTAQVALVTELAGDPLHLAAQARHLGETELVHLRRRALRRGVEPHQVRVPDIAGRQLRPARTVTRVRQILLLQVLVQAPIGRQHLFAEHARVVGGESLALGDRESRRKTQDRPPEHALPRVLDPDLRQLRQDRLDDDFRQHDALVDTETQVVDHVVVQATNPFMRARKCS